MVFRNFLGCNFFPVGPPPVGNGDLVGFWPVLGLGHLKKFRTGAKNKKSQFPGARGPKMKKTVITVSGMVFRNFLTVYVLADRTPRVEKSRNTGVSGCYCPG